MTDLCEILDTGTYYLGDLSKLFTSPSLSFSIRISGIIIILASFLGEDEMRKCFGT